MLHPRCQVVEGLLLAHAAGRERTRRAAPAGADAPDALARVGTDEFERLRRGGRAGRLGGCLCSAAACSRGASVVGQVDVAQLSCHRLPLLFRLARVGRLGLLVRELLRRCLCPKLLASLGPSQTKGLQSDVETWPTLLSQLSLGRPGMSALSMKWSLC